MSEPKHPPFPGAAATWHDVAFAIVAAKQEAYLEGHEDGHRVGWNSALARAKTNDAHFVRALADELRRRDLEEDQIDTSDRREWIRKLIESLEAKERRDQIDARVRRERAYREQRTAA